MAIILSIVLVLVVVVALPFVGIMGGTLVIKKARMLQARQEAASLEIAVKGYHVEYMRLPYPGDSQPAHDNSAAYDTTQKDGIVLLDILRGSTTTQAQNPREMKFWDPPPPKRGSAGVVSLLGGLSDPWGSLGYRMHFDYDNDGVIADPSGAGPPISSSVLIYSAGPDGDFSTWADNVCSWK